MNTYKDYVLGYGEYNIYSIDENNTVYFAQGNIQNFWGRINHHKRLNKSYWLPVKWYKWKPYNWIVPIANDPYYIAQINYGKTWNVSDTNMDQICDQQIDLIDKDFCSANNRESKIDICKMFYNIIKNGL